MAEKGGYKHFMLKEIYEQPRAVRDTIRGRFSMETGQSTWKGWTRPSGALATIKRIVLVACGTSWHAGLVGKFLLEELVRIPVEVDYRLRVPVPRPDPGRGDAGRRDQPVRRDRRTPWRPCGRPRRQGCKSLAICNVVGSTLSRESDGVLYTHAGPEIGVASTKAFTAQLAALYLLALALGRAQAAGSMRPDRKNSSASWSACHSRWSRSSVSMPSWKPGLALFHRHQFPLPRSRHQLPDRARRRAEAEGDLLHPRRGLSGG